MSATRVTRRDFLKVSALAGGGMLIGFRLGEAQPAGPVRANAWVTIAPDGAITITCGRAEMGQDVYTSLSMLLAEELAVDPRRVRVIHAPADPAYVNTMIGVQITGGSTSVREGWEPLRKAGATARELLIAAAAAQWKVSPAECRAANGVVSHGPRRAGYGSLAAAAAKLPVPQSVALKEPARFSVIGKPVPRLDGAAKARGRATYGIDVKQPGMLYAALVPCPVIGGKVAAVDDAAAKARPGVRAVVNLGEGVAVVADHYWNARRAAEALVIQWDEGPGAALDTGAVLAALDRARGKPAFVAKQAGDAAAALASGALEAEYRCQMLSHATLEPQNCTARVTADAVDVWASVQYPQGAQQLAAEAAGLKQEQVRVHPQFLGGGFGRRLENDFVAQAVNIAKAVPGTPVQLIWSRPEDLQHDFYRPPSLHLMRGAVSDGRLTALSATLVSPSITARAFPPFVQKGNDPFMTEGLINLTYEVPNLELRTIIEEVGVRVGYWRSVSHALNAFAVESFLDELALAAKQDPLAFRLALLDKLPRQRAVLERAAKAAGYQATPGAGRGFGVAAMECYETNAAMVCEVSGSADRVKLERLTICADCGVAIHPDQVVAQLEGGVVTGLIQTLRAKITLKNGRVEQSNFDSFPLPRHHEVPPVQVELLQSGGKPGGIGEVGVPLVAPAVANAVFSLTGKRIRTTPLEDGGVRFG
ncbi:MAG TPA: molybdopterin cofactor-binding domain-containing protein [Gemmatimonadales bacterium]|nr:molybdopterin cofactor-binding domain-containing protein [Gemmatimonadales bacterium]